MFCGGSSLGFRIWGVKVGGGSEFGGFLLLFWGGFQIFYIRI